MNEFFNLEAIKKILPQRYPLLMLERAQKIADSEWVAIKNVSINEPHFQGHFPNHPIMPGVLQLEAIKQLGELAVRGELDPKGENDVYIRLVEKVKFRRPTLPGDRLKIELKVESVENGEAVVSGKTINNSGVSCEGKLTLAVRPRIGSSHMPVLFDEYDKHEATPMDISKIMSLVPHRYPFLLIDQIAKMQDDDIVAIKNVSANEIYFGNCPDDYAVMPESLLCEIAAQSGCACVLSRPENQGKIGYFMSIDRAESFGQIYPGDRLVCNIDLPPSKSKFGKGTGFIEVGGVTKFKITLMFAIVEA